MGRNRGGDLGPVGWSQAGKSLSFRVRCTAMCLSDKVVGEEALQDGPVCTGQPQTSAWDPGPSAGSQTHPHCSVHRQDKHRPGVYKAVSPESD